MRDEERISLSAFECKHAVRVGQSGLVGGGGIRRDWDGGKDVKRTLETVGEMKELLKSSNRDLKRDIEDIRLKIINNVTVL